MMVVQVRIRQASESDSKPFTVWPITELDQLVTEFNRWGNPTEDSAFGQFSYDTAGNWFFELVIGDE